MQNLISQIANERSCHASNDHFKIFTENLPFSLEVDYCKAYDSLIQENFKSKSNNALNDVQCLTFKGGMIAAITNLERSATQRGVL